VEIARLSGAGLVVPLPLQGGAGGLPPEAKPTLQPRTSRAVPGGAEDGRIAGDLWTRTLYLGLGAFILTAAVTLAKTGRDALYFQHGGLYDLPNAYLGMALLSVPLGLLTIKLMRRMGPRRARLWVLSAMAGFFFFYAQVATPGGGPFMTVLYMLVPLTIGLAFSLYWLLAADLLEGAGPAQIGRAYSLIGASSIAGGLVGGLVARLVASHSEPRTLILLGALAVAGSLAIVARAQLRFPPPLTTRIRTTGTRSLRDFWCVLRERYSLLLLLTGMATALVGLLVEFRFYVAAATSGNDARQNASLFASIYLVLNAAALVVQLIITPRLQKAVGVHGSLLVLPTAVLGGATTLLASASLFGPSLLRALEGGLRSSVHRVSWEQAYLSIERPRRAQAKLIVDGIAGRLAEGVIALVLLVWLRLVVGGRPLVGDDTSSITYLLLAASLVWVGLVRTLGGTRGDLAAWRRSPEALQPNLPLPDT
jgi:AAA family ATP:ADP antiporter